MTRRPGPVVLQGVGMPESWPLIGRSEVLAELVELAKSGSRAGAVIVGPPGVGRTRIARAAVAAVVDATRTGREQEWPPDGSWPTPPRPTSRSGR